MNVAIILIFSQINWQYADLIIRYSNLMIIFNLMPIFPLDGHRVLKDTLTLIYDDEYADDVMKYVMILMLVIFGIVIYISKSLGLLIIEFFLIYKVISNIKSSSKIRNINKYTSFYKMITNK